MFDRLDQADDVFVLMLAMRFPIPADKVGSVHKFADHLYSSMAQWSNRLLDWLDVAFDKKPAPTNTEIPLFRHKAERLHGLLLERVDEGGNTTAVPPPPQPTTSRLELVPSLEEADWWAIVDRVNAGVDPPVERLLLRDALRELEQQHPRRAVLDAGTAAELALTRMLDTELQELPRNIAELISRQSRQLGRLTETLSRLGIALPQTLQPDLIDVRNGAAHRGTPPTIEQAELAFNLAHALVERAQPIRGLLAGPIGWWTAGRIAKQRLALQ
jgi:hypothetical protein